MIDSKLETFITVCKIKNFTKASKYLNITQPAVSQHIKALEDYYGVKLIIKSGKQMNLTEEGIFLYEEAIKLNRLSKSIKAKLKSTNSIVKRYNVGATLTIGGYVLPQILGYYKKFHQNNDVLLTVNNTELIIKKLMTGEIDLALVEGPFVKSKVLYRKFKDDELVLAFSPNHDFNKKNSITVNDVLKGNLILREKGSGTRKIIENKILSIGYDLDEVNTYMEIGDINAIISLVESNLGYTIISKEAIKSNLRNKTLCTKPIRDFKLYREFNFIYLEGSPMDFTNEFIKFCNNYR